MEALPNAVFAEGWVSALAAVGTCHDGVGLTAGPPSAWCARSERPPRHFQASGAFLCALGCGSLSSVAAGPVGPARSAPSDRSSSDPFPSFP